MTATILKFHPRNATDNPDHVLKQAEGEYKDVLIIGWNKDGSLDVRTSEGMRGADLVWAIDLFKHELLNGGYNE